MEPPPLRVPTYLSTANGGVGLSGIQVFGIATVVTAIAKQSELSARGSDASKALQEKLDADGVWVATIIVALEFEKQLISRGYSAEVNDGIALFSTLKSRDYTFFGGEWSRSLGAWYKQDAAVSESLGETTDGTILEVGIMTYEIIGDSLALQVAAKLIDAKTGLVLSATRKHNAWNMPRLNPLDQAFTEDGLKFKSAFNSSMQTLVTKCLDELQLSASINPSQ
jgi:hypothetical protein